MFDAGWPDLVIATVLLLMFLRSAWRVLRSALKSYREAA
jgi:Co/Zn/Cd efflux system component